MQRPRFQTGYHPDVPDGHDFGDTVHPTTLTLGFPPGPHRWSGLWGAVEPRARLGTRQGPGGAGSTGPRRRSGWEAVLFVESRGPPGWGSLGAVGTSPGHWAEAGNRAVAADSSGSARGWPLRALRVSPWGPREGLRCGALQTQRTGALQGRPGVGCCGAGPGDRGCTAQWAHDARQNLQAPMATHVWMLPWPPRPSPRAQPDSGDPARPFLTAPSQPCVLLPAPLSGCPHRGPVAAFLQQGQGLSAHSPSTGAVCVERGGSDEGAGE